MGIGQGYREPRGRRGHTGHTQGAQARGGYKGHKWHKGHGGRRKGAQRALRRRQEERTREWHRVAQKEQRVQKGRAQGEKEGQGAWGAGARTEAN
jgi:hypothetical protein